MSHRRRLVAPAVCLLSLFVGLASGKEPPKGMDAGKSALNYLKPDAVDFVKLLPAPPKMETQEQENELAVVLWMQEKRTDAEIKRAQSEQKLKLTAFAPVIGEWCTAENLPLTAKLIKAVEADSKVFSAAAKDHFARPRPPHDPRVKPVIDGEEEPSYPSGHATRGMLFGSILAQIDPDQDDALMDRAREIGWDRVIAGVHYPSDIVAGRVLGKALFEAMKSNPEFQKDLEAAKNEFATARRARS